MQSGSTAKGQWVEEWREKEVGNRLQIVSLARFGCVLTCGGGGQGKARQGKARRICLPKQKAIKTTPSGSWGGRRRADQREVAVLGESSTEARRAVRKGERGRGRGRSGAELLSCARLEIWFFFSQLRSSYIHICAIFVAVIVVLYMRHICCCYCYCCCYSVAIVGKLKSWEQLSNGTNRRRISFQFRFANFSPLSNVLLLLCLSYYYCCCCCWRSLLGARLEASRRRWFFLRLIPITWDTTWN